MAEDEELDPIREALRMWVQGQRDVAMAEVKALADQGDLTACVVMAQFLRAYHGNANESADAAYVYARMAQRAGLAQPGIWWLPQYLNSGNRDHISLGVDLALLVQAGAPTIDVLENWQLTWERGYEWAAHQLFKITADPTYTSSVTETQQAIRDTETLVGAARDSAIQEIELAKTTTLSEAERVQGLMQRLSTATHEAAADDLAKSYSKQAMATHKAAVRWTAASIFVALLAAAWAVGVAIEVFKDDNPSTPAIIGKSLVSVSLFAIAGYLASLARSNRRMAWHWTHVALQIRTADPYIGNLPSETRERLQAALAVRLFPGQGQDPQANNASEEKLDMGMLVAAVLGDPSLQGVAPKLPRAQDSPQDS